MTPMFIELDTSKGKITLNCNHILLFEPAGADKIGQSRVAFINGMMVEIPVSYTVLCEAMAEARRGF